MKLTRRDVTAALAAMGVVGGGALGDREWRCSGGPDCKEAIGDDRPELASDRRLRDVYVAVAGVVFPGDVSGVAEFVEGVLSGRLAGDDEDVEPMRRTTAELDDLAASWYGAPVPELDPSTLDRLLQEVGADAADEDPDGTLAERVRYYVVDELLLALYSSPTGAELVGLENPQGHPGGTDSYQRGPQS